MEIGGTSPNGGFQCSTTGGVFPVPPLSAFHFLRNYNYLLAPRSPVPDFITKQILPGRLELSNLEDIRVGESQKLVPAPPIFDYPHYSSILAQERMIPDFITKQILPGRLELSNLEDIRVGESQKLVPAPPIFGYPHYSSILAQERMIPDFITKQILPGRLELSNLEDIRVGESQKLVPAPPIFGYPHYSSILAQERMIPKTATCATSILSHSYRKQRGQKKPIPAEQKDDKYFERRRRNNQAAKKSRDARKQREDHVALRATLLEHENALLKAQVITLREEASSLRQLLLEKKTFEFQQTSHV